MRLGVYCDFSYRVEEEAIYAERPFSLFIEGLAAHCERLVVFGRLDEGPGRYPFRLRSAELVPLPHYRSGADLGSVMRSLPLAVRRFRRALSELDVVWVLGPNPPHAVLFPLLARLGGRRVVLGVRQNLPELIRHRRPDQRVVQASALLLEATFRGLARFFPVAVVGPDLAKRYHGARSLLTLYVSLLRESDLLPAAEDDRRYDDEALVMLSVGRLDPEKNPLLLADVLRRAVSADSRWRLEVCGDGPLAGALAERARELGVADRLVQHGYVPIDKGLWDFYRRAHALLHVSMSEGLPQVILEAFAARLPVVGTDVGSVGELLAGQGLAVPPGDAAAAADALARLVQDGELRRRLVESAHKTAEAHTLAAETARLAGFLSGGA